MSKRILFLTEEFGSGHTKAAEALMQGIAQLDPSVDLQMMEPSKILHPITSAFMLRSYKKLISHYPALWKKIYYNKTTPDFVQTMIYHLFHRNMDRVLHHMKPDLIISTHPFSSSSIAHVKRLGLPLRLCTVITDLHVHRVWVQPGIDLYIASHKEVRRQLIELGVPLERIAVTGMPVRMNFWKKNNKSDIRKRLHLQDLPTVILMGGGWGTGKMKEIAYSLLKWKDVIQCIICTGKNDALTAALAGNIQFQHPNIRITGYVDRIDRWFDAADLIITKPGGITIFEALTKSLPLMLYNPIPGHEEYNCSHLVNSNLAVRINQAQEMDEWLEKLLYTPSAFDPWIARMKQFQQELHPLAGAQSVLELLHHSAANASDTE